MEGTSSLWKWAAIDARGLAAFRIAIGVIVVADAILRCRDLSLMFTPDGIFPPDLVRTALGGPTAWSLAWLDDSVAWARCLLALEGLCGLALACGWHTRLAAVCAWVAVVSIVRRTAPATNAGDLWLTSLLLWGCFLPLGMTWSVDARRVRAAACRTHGPMRSPVAGVPGAAFGFPGLPATRVVSPASAALVLQIGIVYLSAGAAKFNGVWLTGDAVAHALSVHDHGTRVGQSLAASPWFTAPAGWGVMGLELAVTPLLVAWPTCRVRGLLAGTFILLHLAIWLLLSVGLFAPVGIAAWLALVPACVWDRFAPLRQAVASATPPGGPPPVRPTWIGATPVVVLGLVALASAVAAHRPTDAPVPGWLRLAIRLTGLEQDWRMFGDVRRQIQWVRASATLADGRQVDLLRGGLPCGEGPPADGYLSLPHHRWHKLCWDLHRPVQRAFAAPLAESLARQWNDSHPASARAVTVEIRNGRIRSGTTEEILLAAWPRRSGSGSGNLERFLRDLPDDPPPSPPEPAPGSGSAVNRIPDDSGVTGED
jgi:hypothetical protein